MSHKQKQSLYVLTGSLTYAASGDPGAGLRVVAMDADLLEDDCLGEATTGADGRFRIAYDQSRFKGLLEGAPDVYVRVYDDAGHLLTSTRAQAVQEAGTPFDLELAIPGAPDVPVTRSRFTTLMLSNPNYFGSFPQFDLKAVEPMSGNTTYEELVCLGLQPDQDRLEAVFTVKKSYGYSSDACGEGSVEYVRFFVERGGVWEDLGVDTVSVYDMPGSEHPLCYTASVPFDEPEKYCAFENLMKVRAILSWNQEPPAGNPTWTPPWGNALDATVQIDAWKLYAVPMKNLLAEQLIEIDPGVLAQLDLEAPLSVQKPAPLSFGALKQLYAKADVPPHRYGFSEALKLTAGPVTSSQLAPLTGTAQMQFPPPDVLIPGPDLGDLLGQLVLTSGNTTYEELTCAGYNPQTREVGGVLHIKRSSGFSGGLCTPGSTEYVGFWVEYGGSWHPMGVAEVQVHDLAGAGGGNTVAYAVVRATNAVPELPCENLAGLRMRAILSWNTPPTGPTFAPTWGNVIETYIQPPTGDPLDEDALNRLRLMRINRAPIDAISNVTGRATDPTPVAGDCGGLDRPFGGNVYIEGDFVDKPDVFDHLTGDVLPGQRPLRYQVFWHKDGSAAAPTQLVNSFTIKVFPEDATLPVTKTQAVTPMGAESAYTYMESGGQAVNPRILAVWNAGGLDDGLYTLEVKGFAWDGTAYVQTNNITQKVYVYNGFPHLEAEAQPDGTVALVEHRRPELTLTMTGGECADITAGSVITGTYTVRDEFFNSLVVRMVPVSIGGATYQNPVVISNPGTVVPHPGVNPTVQTVSGTWSLDTAGLPACGYTVELAAWDRALVSNGCTGHYHRLAVGFCLRAANEA